MDRLAGIGLQELASFPESIGHERRGTATMADERRREDTVGCD
jgi:hypothetical protein